jgi:GNAT superfamily N-acetyltransferase/RimJ/RimL family protein N-acetyltransferase
VIIERFDPRSDTARLRDCYEIVAAGWPVDRPNEPMWTFESFTGEWAHGFGAQPQQVWLATDDADRPVGCYLLRLPERENTTMGDCMLTVAPNIRQAGWGRQLLAHCADQARAAGRDRLSGEVRDGSAGAAFAAAAGATAGIAEVIRVLDVGGDVAARLPALRDEAARHAVGYSLVSWTGRTPEEYLDAIVRLEGAMADAPHDPGVETWNWDADRIRKSEDVMFSHGIGRYTVAARHDMTGELAAFTAVGTEAGTPDWGFQFGTMVLAGHRGHRLGLLVKVVMLEWLLEAEPTIRRIVTGNAGANAHMIAINEQLGFTVADTYRSWELDLRARPARAPLVPGSARAQS